MLNYNKFFLHGLILLLFSSCASLHKADDYSVRVPERTRQAAHKQNKTIRPAKLKKRSEKSTRIRSQILDQAVRYKGVPYKYGGTDPSGFDCSGFVYYVYKKLGYQLPRTSKTLANSGKRKALSACKPGDIVLFGERGKVGHVAIVYSNDSEGIKVIHSTSSKGVIISDISNNTYWKKRSLFAQDVLNTPDS